MKKYFLFLFILLNGAIYAQNYKIVILSNLSGLRTNQDYTPDSLLSAIKKAGGVNSIICLGSATKTGTFSEIDDSKKFLDSLKLDYKILFGQNEFLQGANGLLNIQKLYENQNFFFDEGKITFIGLQLNDLKDFEKGHVSINNINWLKSALPKIKNKSIILVLSTEIEKIDNFEKLIPILKDKNVVEIITPELPFNIPDGSSNENNANIPPAIFNLITLNNDTLYTYQLNPGSDPQLLEKKLMKSIKLEGIAGTVNEEHNYTEILNINTTTVSKVLHYKSNYIISDISGKITNYNPNFTTKWQYTLSGKLAASPIMVENRLVIASGDGDIIVLNPETKEEMQSIGVDCNVVSPLLAIDYKGTKELLIPKSTSSVKALVFGDARGNIYCYDMETLQELWINSDSKLPVMQEIIEADNKLVFKNCVGNIFCIDSRTGLLIWKWGFNESASDNKTGLLFNGKEIITLTTDNQAVGLDLLLGLPNWQIENTLIKDIFISPANKNNLIAVTDYFLTIFDSRSGKKIKDIKLKERNITKFLNTDIPSKQAFVLSSDNILYSVDDSYNLKKAAYIGTSSIVSFSLDSSNLYLMNIDGSFFKIPLN